MLSTIGTAQHCCRTDMKTNITLSRSVPIGSKVTWSDSGSVMVRVTGPTQHLLFEVTGTASHADIGCS